MVVKDLWADKHSSRRIRVVKKERVVDAPTLPSNESRYVEESTEENVAEKQHGLEILKAATWESRSEKDEVVKSDFYHYLNSN